MTPSWPNSPTCSPNSIWLVMSRHATYPMHFGIRKVVTRRVVFVGQHGATHSSRLVRLARHVFRGVATAWTGVMSTSLFPKVVPKIDANPEHKRLNLYTRALLLHCPPSPMLEQARCDTIVRVET